MKIKISVSGPDGRHTEVVADVAEEGDLPRAVGEATGDYRKLYPDARPFDYFIKVAHA